MNCKTCSTEGCCPFAQTEASMIAESYGCLPTFADIIHMRQIHGKTWACHNNIKKPCLGALLHQKERKLKYKVIDSNLLSEDVDWSIYTKH